MEMIRVLAEWGQRDCRRKVGKRGPLPLVLQKESGSWGLRINEGKNWPRKST